MVFLIKELGEYIQVTNNNNVLMEQGHLNNLQYFKKKLQAQMDFTLAFKGH